MPSLSLPSINALADALQRVSDTVRRKSSAVMPSSSSGGAGSEGLYPTNRVGQLDAAILDDELFEIFKNQIWDGSKFIHSAIKDHYTTELCLLLKLVLWKFTVWDNSASYGLLLQNLRLADARNSRLLKSPSKAQKLALGFVVVFGEYLWRAAVGFAAGGEEEEEEEGEEEGEERGGNIQSKLHSLLHSPHFKKPLTSLLDKSESIYTFLDLLNFLTFLYNGRYPTLLFRICRLRLISSSRTMSRNVSFEFLNRQLVWDEFTSFLIFVLPMLHLPRVKRRIGRLLSGRSSSVPPPPTTDEKQVDEKKAEQVVSGPLSFLPERTCAICYHQDSAAASTRRITALEAGTVGLGVNEITNPYAAEECGHVYCYVCLVTQIEEQEGEGWECLRCRAMVRRAVPWVDVEKGEGEEVEGGEEDGEDEEYDHLESEQSEEEDGEEEHDEESEQSFGGRFQFIEQNE
ncbi:Pex12 amino terminal region-domain-containing protein [Myxozyma melibiosi]|uniref:RING-type E3 ubiquitin transferase (cysteine targeting) n=1 Tax=Myxozyma melibiosi TaxID=54550 RepID=A0ABR1F776_9ASCO